MAEVCETGDWKMAARSAAGGSVAEVQTDAEIDFELISEVKAGSRPALAALYDRHAPSMLGVALRILGDRVDAEDLVHDVFLEAWNKAATHDASRGSVRAWLLMRVRSRGIDRVRSLSTARKHGMAQRAAPPPPVPDHGASPDHRRAREAVAQLSEVQRVVLEAVYFQGLSCQEVADREGIPIGTAKSRLAAALTRLRTLFRARQGDRR